MYYLGLYTPHNMKNITKKSYNSLNVFALNLNKHHCKSENGYVQTLLIQPNGA